MTEITREGLSAEPVDIRKLATEFGIKGCGDHSCYIERPDGMATNGGCRCRPDKFVRIIQRLRSLTPGMVLVPEEPTPEMIQAMEDRQTEGATYIAENSIQYALWKEVWKAALAASRRQP